LFTIYCIVMYIVKNNYIPWNCPSCTIHVNTESFSSHSYLKLQLCIVFLTKQRYLFLSTSFVNLATVFLKLTSRSIPLFCSWIKGCEYCECLYFYNYFPYRIVSKITISSPFVSIRIVSCDDRIVSSLLN